MKNSVLSFIQDNFESAKAYCLEAKDKLIDSYKKDIVDKYEELKNNFQDLENTNINLAYRHLENGNYSDAMLRVVVLKKIFKFYNQEVQYLESVANFFKKNFEQAAIIYPKDYAHDKYGVAEVIMNPKIKKLPVKFFNFIRRRSYKPSYQEMAQFSLVELKKALENSSLERLNILTLEAPTEDIIYDLQENLAQDLNIKFYHSNGLITSIVKKINKPHITTEIYNLEENIELKDKFDVILIPKLDWTCELSALLDNLVESLSQEHYIIIGVYLYNGDDYKLDPLNGYNYGKEFIEKGLMQAGLKLLNITLQKDGFHTLYVSKK